MTYNWGNFKHDPMQVLARYFDAYLYYANWGTRILAFRFPADADLTAVSAYCVEDAIELTAVEGKPILTISYEEDSGYEEWEAVEDGLSPFVRLRNDILQGDYRALYIAWLGAMGRYPDDPDAEEMPEPPVPPGLKNLNTALKRLAELIAVDDHLIEAAAENSTKLTTTSDDALRQAIAQLPRQNCDALLLRLARGESGVGAALQKEIRPFLQQPKVSSAAPRTYGEIVEAAERLAKAAARRRAEATRKQHIAEMEELAKREAQTWQQVTQVIESGKSASIYKEATALLAKLQQLAEFQGKPEIFRVRIAELAGKYVSRPALIQRWKEKGWT